MDETRCKELIQKEKEENTSYTNYCEDDRFTFSGSPVFTVLDFWRFSYGYLAGQSPAIAEFLVAKALGIEKAENVTYWTAYDMSYRGKRVEVKSTEYVHAWNKDGVSKVRTFSIAPTHNAYWENAETKALSRQSDLYVFCVNTNREFQNPQPLILDHWDFYPVATSEINSYAEKNGNPDQKTISLSVIEHLAGDPVKWNDLKAGIDKVIDG